MKNFLIFGLGAIVGASGMFFGIRKYYEDRSNREIEQVKIAFGKAIKNDKNITVTKEEDISQTQETVETQSYENEELKNYRNTHEINYRDASNVSNQNADDDEDDKPYVFDPPYVITPEIYDYGDDSPNDKKTVIYYSIPDVLIAENGQEMIIEDTIGRESLDNIGVFEKDTVHVRNDKLGIDYEVLLDNRSEIV